MFMNFDEKEEEIKTKGTMYSVTTLAVIGTMIAFLALGILFVWKLSEAFFETLSTETDNSNENDRMESVRNMNVIINNKKYHVTLEDNETVKKFLELLPQEFTMEELNGNEKYVYMSDSLPTNATIPNHITAGDIMLYGDRCVVIFYKSFDTSYSYTKIGHIEDLSDLENGSIIAKFEK